MVRDDPVAIDLMQQAGAHVDALAARLIALGAERIALVGGLAPHLAPRLGRETRRHLVAPEGDAVAGALQLARAEAAAPHRERVA
jgi:glucosamine kinase